MTTEMSEKTRITVAKDIFEDLEGIMLNLYARWRDESDYEDITDYAEPIKETIESVGGSIVKMTKRPFGVVYTLADATYKITVTIREYSYKRIK